MWRVHRQCRPDPLHRVEVLACEEALPRKTTVESRMNLDAYRITSEPYYQPVADEVAVFEAAYSQRASMSSD